MLTPGAEIAELFMELVAIPSPSGRERELAERIAGWLCEAGVVAEFDGTGAENDSDAGNLIATVPGATGAPTLLFVAHMDTVESGPAPIRPRRGDDGVIRSGGDTILGADNKSAVAAVMRMSAAASRTPVSRRPTVIAAFTSREEAGRMGASLLDLGALGVDCAFSVDGSQPIGTVITSGLGQMTFVAAVRGRAAHAAADPEAGINAISVAAEAVSALELGRRRGGGTANIAAILGGSVIGRLDGSSDRSNPPDPPDRPDRPDRPPAVAALAASPTNSVPDVAWLRGEVRGASMDEIERDATAIKDTLQGVCARRGARLEWTPGRTVPPMPGARDSRALALVRSAVQQLPGATLELREAHATLEANYLAAQADVVAVASGGRDAHQFSESIAVTELAQLEALLAGIVGLAAPVSG